MTGRANTWSGVLGHLAGIENNSGRNGLATWDAAKPSVDRVIAEFSWRNRYYGQRFTGTSHSVSKTANFGSGPFRGGVTLGAKIGGIEGRVGVSGEFDLTSVFRLGRQLSVQLPNFAWARTYFDALLSVLPTVAVTGEVAVYLGVSSQNVGYTRVQTGARASFRLPRPISNTAIRGVSARMGRSWQIQFRNWSGHIPTRWA